MHPIDLLADVWQHDPLACWQYDPLTYWFLLFIVGVWVVGLATAAAPVSRRNAQLRRLNGRISGVLAESGSPASQTARDRATRLLCDVDGLRRPTETYDRWWRSAFISGPQAAVGERTLDSFVAESDLVSPWSRAIAGVLPGVLVALGILGTFWGLVNGLPSVSSASNVAQAPDFRSFVNNITKSLGLAFYTSIFGIVGSVTFLLLDKTLVAILETRLRRLSDAVAVCFPTISTEELRRLSFSVLEDGVATLKGLSTDLAQSLANYMGPALQTAMQAQLAPAIAAIQTSVDRLVTFSSEGQVAGVKGLVDGFVGSMNEAMGLQFEQLKEVIARTIEEQAKIGEGVRTFTILLRSTAQSQSELVERTIRLARGLGQSVESLERTAPALKEAASGFGDLAESLSEAAESLTQANNQAGAKHVEVAKLASEHLAAIEAGRKELTDAWNVAVADAKGAIHQISEATRQVGEGVGDQLLNALAQFDGALGDAVNRFSGTLLQLDATVKELPPAALGTKEAFEGTKDQVLLLLQGVTALRDIATTQLAQYGRDTATAAAHLHGVVETSQKTLRMGADTTDLISKAVLDLNAMAAGFGKRVEELHSAASVLQGLAKGAGAQSASWPRSES